MRKRRKKEEMLNNAAHFIFDSDHLDCIHSRLYGYYVTEAGMFTDVDLSQDISDECGSWVRVKRTPELIEITQDATGCFGLFLYRYNQYWALSNSFNHLLDYLKKTHKISFNKDYADAFLSQQLCVSLYGETIIREISWLDRRSVILIDPASRVLSTHFRLLREKTVPIDTKQGLKLLDFWYDKWSAFIKAALYSWPGIIQS